MPMRRDQFTFLCNNEERRLLATLAERLQRSRSDVVRSLIRRAAHELGINSDSTNSEKSERNEKQPIAA